MKVLLAEDSLTMRRLLVAQLQRWNYEVTAVEDGAHRLEHRPTRLDSFLGTTAN